MSDSIDEVALVARYGQAVMTLSPANRITYARKLEAELRSRKTAAPAVAPITVAQMVAIHGPGFNTFSPVKKLNSIHLEAARRAAVAKATAP